MTIGIYAIRNKIDGKMYIGKSSNMEKRIKDHIRLLKASERNEKQTNRFLWNAVKLHGIDNFEFMFLESFEVIDDGGLADCEIKWMDYYNSCNRDYGYNLRRDSSTKTEVHSDTRLLISELNKGENNPNFGNKWTEEQKRNMSNIKRKQFEDGLYDWVKTDEWRKAKSEVSSALWKDEEKKKVMAAKVAESKSKLMFLQYDKNTNELVRIWNSINEILTSNPDYHRIAIYSVCNGHKKSYRGFIWKSKLKVSNERLVL